MKPTIFSSIRRGHHKNRIFITLLVATMLTACQSMPVSGFTKEQESVLMANGFVETAQGWELTMADRLLFDVNESLLKPEQLATIARLGATLKQVGIGSARVEGHTDNTGSARYNQLLSQARALSVAAPLRDSGIVLAPGAVLGRGEAFPVGDNGTEAGRTDNRRVVIIVTP